MRNGNCDIRSDRGKVPGRCSYCRRGFSLIELLVVILVISILLSMIFLVGQSVIQDGKIKKTRLMLSHLQEAVETYRDQHYHKAMNPVLDRYGNYPPDDIMTYTPLAADSTQQGAGHGVNGIYEDIPNLMPGGLGTFVRVGAGPLSGLTDDIGASGYVPNGDIKALVWALRNHEKSRIVYDTIPKQYRVSVDLAVEFFDVDGDNIANYSAPLDPLVDKDVEYLVDSWGVPLEYFSSAFLVEKTLPSGNPTAHGGAAELLVEANKDRPLLVSYGPDGKFQLEEGVTLPGQYVASPFSQRPFINERNQDNVYCDDAVVARIAEAVKTNN